MIVTAVLIALVVGWFVVILGYLALSLLDATLLWWEERREGGDSHLQITGRGAWEVSSGVFKVAAGLLFWAFVLEALREAAIGG